MLKNNYILGTGEDEMVLKQNRPTPDPNHLAIPQIPVLTKIPPLSGWNSSFLSLMGLSGSGRVDAKNNQRDQSDDSSFSTFLI